MSGQESQNLSCRCLRCRLQLRICVCKLMPCFDLRTQVVVLMQHKEFGISTNTGHFIPKILKNAEIRFRGSLNQVPIQVNDLIDDEYDSLLLFPGENTSVLTDNFVAALKKKPRLVVLDGNWRQAAKMIKRLPVLDRMKKVVLPALGPSRYRLRESPREDGVCTLEAVARAIGILEGGQCQSAIENFFEVFVERYLWTRTLLKANEVTGGIPDL